MTEAGISDAGARQPPNAESSWQTFEIGKLGKVMQWAEDFEPGVAELDSQHLPRLGHARRRPRKARARNSGLR
jgi:hypothetical protein